MRDLRADGPAVRPYPISLRVGRDRRARRRGSDIFRNCTLAIVVLGLLLFIFRLFFNRPPMTQPDDDTIKRMHRWFAVECNNNAWALTGKAGLTADNDRDLLATAYASAFHWKAIGNPINRTRADMLLGYVHALLGDDRRAARYGREAISGLDADGATDWDRAFAHLVVAMASGIADDGETFEAAYAKAETLGERLERTGDREDFKAYLEKVRLHPSQD